MLSKSDERRKRLEELDNFVADSKKKLSSIVSVLGWSIDSISDNVEEMVTCPFNESHRVPEKSLVEHLEDCQWKAEGYGKKDLPLSTPSLPPGTSMAIKFDEQLQEDVIRSAKQQNPAMTIGVGGRLIPRTSDRLVAEFTRDERLAMYEYVIANTAQPDIGEDITDMNKPKSSGDGKTSSYLELLAQERNLKRRRAKYRGVHTNKKSQVEILREVINQQMEMLADYISEKNDDPVIERDDFTRDREADRHEKSRGFDKSGSRSADNNGSQFPARFSARSEDFGFRGGTSNDRGYDRGNGFHDSREKNTRRDERGKYTNEYEEQKRDRRVSDERTSRTSTHKSHRHRSRDRNEERYKRRRSRDREESRSSRDSRHSERRSESSRSSRCDDRSSKKRRGSRDR